MSETKTLLDEREVDEAFARLKEHMPGRTPTAKGPKDQPDPFRSLVACALSAQSLDRNTDAAARALFSRISTPQELLDLPEAEIAGLIRPCGLYNMKARNLKKLAQALVERQGAVPRDRAGLMALPGIGRKCADIVMAFTFGEAVIAVDTHVDRVCNRLGLTHEKTAERTAAAIETRAPRWALMDGHFWLIQFGKTVCLSRRPRCQTCFLADLCLFVRAQESESTSRIE